MTRPYALLLATLAAGVSAAAASAQPQPAGGAPARPTFSPYLNLLNGNNGPALNYFGLVRPQQQLQQQFGQLQQQMNQNAQDQQQYANQLNVEFNQLNTLFLPPTGNVATFNNTGGHFNRLGGGGYGSARFGGGGNGYGTTAQRPSFAGGRSLSGSGGVRPPAGGVPPR